MNDQYGRPVNANGQVIDADGEVLDPQPPPPMGAQAGGADPITGWPSIEAAHMTVHAGENKANLQGPEFYGETNLAWHPLLTEWAGTLKPLSAPDPPTVGEKCVIDCKEREKNRKRECAEIRKRVQQKLKEIGCPSKVSSTDKAAICGQKKAKPVVKTVAAKKKKNKSK